MRHTGEGINLHGSVKSAVERHGSRLQKKKISSRSPLAGLTEMRRAKSVEQKSLRRGRALTTHPYTARFERPHLAHKSD